ncbi:MAG: 3-hydroxyacyl-CoA dehydrogenase NAD-binding domain-containing protein [Bacteroidia bacterium]
MKKIAIIGAGTMGIGIAQVAASAGCEVLVHDAYSAALSRGMNNLEQTFKKLVEKGKFTQEDASTILNRIKPAYELSELMHSDLVIEAIIESIDVKRTIFKGLENFVKPKCILATNTSSLSIASIAAACNHPERVIGIHFFNPAPLMKLVEVIAAVQTSESTLRISKETISSWGKTVAIAKDTPGFIVNRVARPFYSEALRIYEEGIADFATIDFAMKHIGGFRMGPFELMDFIGNDVNYAVTESVFTAFYFDPRYKPSFTQKRLSEAGFLGRKSGRGYYDYREGAFAPPADENEGINRQIFERILAMLINEAADALFFNVASATDIDNAMQKGVNYPKGLLAWADEFGIDRVVDTLDSLYDEYHEDRYRCSSLLRRMKRESKSFYK